MQVLESLISSLPWFLTSVRVCCCSCSFMLKCTLNYIVQFMIQRKAGLPGLLGYTGELFPFILSYDKSCGKLALGHNCQQFLYGTL